MTKDDTAARAKLDAFIESLANDLRPAVKAIEASPKTTKDHYGRYLALFSTMSDGDRRKGKLICAALLVAGANHNGVAAAYKISFGESRDAYGR